MSTVRRLLLLLPFLLLTGCWSKVEIDEQIFVFAIYVDKGDKPGTVKLTISSPLPNRMMSGQQAGSGGSGGGKPYAIISKTGDTIPDAFMDLQKDLTRRLNFGHTREIIVGRDYAEEGIGDLLDWIRMEPAFHISSFLGTAPGKAREVADLIPLYEQMPAEVLRKMNLQHVMFSTTVRDCLIANSSKVGFVTNYMLVGTQPTPSENGKSEEWVGIRGAALYQHDKFKGTLEAEEARALAWATGRLDRLAYTVYWDKGDSRASVLFTDLKATKKVTLSDGTPRYTITLTGFGDLLYKKDSKQRDETELNSIITTQLNAKVKLDLERALHQTRQLGSDALGLGLLLEWKYPGLWERIREDWTDYYKDKVEIEVKTTMNVRYLTNKP
ncbi:Ger(x)C family spore germination protein [Paenibacillus tuaregi]|uniref:Ger(x)C family spore germination protein n=1 Tax=Paenibacillus tuaregi TaxID=1816681 RepID=UPI0008391177|nr:Ger(x)C family spore germination protein [Paenibacillus tuaregi]